MNKKQLGRSLEKKVRDFLVNAGWTTWLVLPKIVFVSGRWVSKPQDIWGADIIAMKSGHINLAIQVTADTGLSRKAKEFSKFPYGPTWLCLIFQAKKKSGKWVFFVYEAKDGKYFPVCPEKLESIFGKSWENIMGKIVYET